MGVQAASSAARQIRAENEASDTVRGPVNYRAVSVIVVSSWRIAVGPQTTVLEVREPDTKQGADR
jgi:hypothetical protein